MLAPFGLQVATLEDYPAAIEVDEPGESFAENARLKASGHATHLGAWVLADDSGLEVAALGGAPGIYSARFAGEGASDEDNNRLLLEKLGDLPASERGARYVCHVAVADPMGQIRAESSGVCGGRIRRAPVGVNGFGYDPLFEIREYHRTFGELGAAVKRALSHRSRAMRAILPQVVALLRN